MPPKKKKTEAAQPFDISQFRAPKRYVWREIDLPEEDAPLRVKLLRLDMREVDGIPYTNETPLKELYEAIAPFVVEWDFVAENLQTGDMVPVPPPAEAGPDVFELFDSSIGIEIATWLKLPNVMAKATEKQSSEPSAATHAVANSDDAA